MKPGNRLKIIFIITFLLPWIIVSQSKDYSLTVNTHKIISSYDKPMLLGVNAGVFYEESYFMDLDFLSYLRQLNPGIIRIPGGSWSNELYWNGNRVRISEESYISAEDWKRIKEEGGNPIKSGFDMTRYKDGKWDVDYSGYAPGFRIVDNEHHLSDFHGFTDVLFLHKFIHSFGAEAMVTVNVGTGTVEMAVEWVKWVKQREFFARDAFDVKYWELGNELDGHWETGYILPDGSKMNAKEYVRRYKLFTTAMKKADPEIKVGGSAASNMSLPFIEELIKDQDAPIDFISFHAYPSKDKDTCFVTMANHAAEINAAVARIKGWIAKYRPDQKDAIEIALTEWNIKVKEDMTTVDLTNTLWSAVMLGEIAGSGIDIAIQWDLFSTTETGGHGLFNPKDPEMRPRSQYWAVYLWSRYMGNNLVETKLNTPDFVRAYTTTDEKFVSVMIINGSKDKPVKLRLELPGTARKMQAQEISYSSDQFELDAKTLLPVKSKKPSEKMVLLKKKKEITISPYSIKILRYPIAKQ